MKSTPAAILPGALNLLLASRPPMNSLSPMKAHDVIDQIKALPPEEQAKVVDFIEEVKALQRVKYADQVSFADAAQWVFAEHAELMRKLSQ